LLHRSSLLRRFAAVSFVVLLTACASETKDKTAGWSPQRIYSEAKEEINSNAFDKAVNLLDKLEGRAAGTPLAQQAQLDKAYAHYKAQEPAQALATLERFMRLHPSSPAIDYALYLKGLVNFNDTAGMLQFITKQDLSERDQRATKESYEAFRELVARFPESRYAGDAKARMLYIVNSLAQYDVHVARYYYQRGAYVAAINRAQMALQDYRDVPALEEALYILIKSYDALGLTQLRDDSARIMAATYPKSSFMAEGFRPAGKPWWKLW